MMFFYRRNRNNNFGYTVLNAPSVPVRGRQLVELAEELTSPAYVAAMGKVVGIVTDVGTVTGHMASTTDRKSVV